MQVIDCGKKMELSNTVYGDIIHWSDYDRTVHEME